MVRIVLAACAFLIVASTSSARTEISFAGVPWGAPAGKVKARMLEHGFTFVKVDQDGDLQFNGVIEGQLTGILALRTKDDKLVKWMITVVPGDHGALDYYRRLKRDLTQQYGQAKVDREEWTFPYAGGQHVGQEEIAIRVGKGVLKAAWATDGTLPAVVIEITDRLVVTAEYEGPGWNEEVDRRKTQPWYRKLSPRAGG